MTSTPSYGFRIKPGEKAGPMQQAISAGDITEARNLLAQRFPYLKFEDLTETEEVAAPAEATPSVSPTALTSAAAQDTTANIYSDYLTNLPGGVRELVTTDYKGVRGARLGRGGYTTESMVPGADLNLPPIKPAEPSAPTTPTTPTTPTQPFNTYNYYTYNLPAAQPAGPTAAPSPASAAATAPSAPSISMRPAWATSDQQTPTTVSKAASGLVPSTQERGAYVSPSSPAASTTAQAHVQTAQAAQQAGTGMGIRQIAAAGDNSKQLGLTGVSAILAGPSSNKEAAQAALKQADKGNITLTSSAREALQKAAKK